MLIDKLISIDFQEIELHTNTKVKNMYGYQCIISVDHILTFK